MITPTDGIVAGGGERVGQLDEGLRAEGVAHLGTADRDLGDALGRLVTDVAVVAGLDPRGQGCHVVHSEA